MIKAVVWTLTRIVIRGAGSREPPSLHRHDMATYSRRCTLYSSDRGNLVNERLQYIYYTIYICVLLGVVGQEDKYIISTIQ